ncbi:hypothetical protein ACFE04_018953 [Oxalis oulophora]
MEFASSKDSSSSSVASSPFSSPNIGALLKIKIISWSQETGQPAFIRVQVGHKTFNLHKYPLFAKSGYFKKRWAETNEVLHLSDDFPGGPDIFEMILLFLYGYTTFIDPFNLPALRCAAEYLDMKEEHSSGNLCTRFDLYLNQVILQSWDDTIIVLQSCQTLLPYSEELLIVSRCIESLAFMACMEILDPECRREKPVISLDSLATQPWSSEKVKEIVNQDLWIKDLIALPFEFFKRVIGSLRRQGMKEKYVSPIVVFYANKWVISKKTRQFLEEKETDSEILKGTLVLLPIGEKSSRVTIPVGFYFAMLSRSLEIGLTSDDFTVMLRNQIASSLQFARVEDFLHLQESKTQILDLTGIESIFSTYVSVNMDKNRTPSKSNFVVAELWDSYLIHVAIDQSMGSKRFMELIETVPLSYRQCHDQLYKAINAFLQAHDNISQEEKTSVCKYLNCQKLSQQACTEAVQNELMPLRLLVQALFVQQLNAHQIFKDCSDSFRHTNCGGEFSGSLLSSRCPNSTTQILDDSPYTEGDSKSLSYLLQKDVEMARCEFSRNEYESTSFRIKNLEQEIVLLKKSLQWQSMGNNTDSKLVKRQSSKRNPIAQVPGCIGSVNFATQRKYANRVMKVFRRIILLGNRRSTRKSS